MSEFVRGLFENNHRWVERIITEDEDFFRVLSEGQFPDFFWIGCSFFHFGLLVGQFDKSSTMLSPDSISACSAI